MTMNVPPLRAPRFRRGARFAAGVVKLGVAAVALCFLWPSTLGGRNTYVVVSGHSMEPTYHTNDLVVVRKQGTPKVGDVVVYRVPKGEPGEAKQVIHRVVGGDAEAGFVTRGDNREGPDIWRPRSGDVIGTVALLVPQGGRFLAVAFNYGNLLVIVLALMAWALWPRDDDDEKADAEPDEAEPADAEGVAV